MEETARKVREEREALGWTQKLLAKKAGCDVRTVRRLEAGARVAPNTVAEVTDALKKARPNVDLKAGGVGVGTGSATASVTIAPPVPAEEKLEMTATAHDEMNGAPKKEVPQATMGDLLALHEKDPKAAEQVILDLMPKPREPETIEEKLTMGYSVIQFLERFSEADVYVVWDTGDPEERKTIAAFITTATQSAKAIRERTFDSSQRFEAQCALADHLNAMHKKSWRVVGLVTRGWNLEGYSTIQGNIVVDQG